MKVSLSTVGNPVFNQDQSKSMPGCVDCVSIVQNFTEAVQACRKYINKHNVGSGNWTGGIVTDNDGNELARISYNCRLWFTTPEKYQGFITALADNPKDCDTRLIFADKLEEDDDHALAAIALLLKDLSRAITIYEGFISFGDPNSQPPPYVLKLIQETEAQIKIAEQERMQAQQELLKMKTRELYEAVSKILPREILDFVVFPNDDNLGKNCVQVSLILPQCCPISMQFSCGNLYEPNRFIHNGKFYYQQRKQNTFTECANLQETIYLAYKGFAQWNT